jgi:LmbE family N-acetylglucosaminyl deacetylase
LNYLFIGAHPDDIEISAMGFLIKLLENKANKVFMSVIALPKDEEIKSIRISEQFKVSSYLGIKYTNFRFLAYSNFYDGNLHNSLIELKNYIEEIITTYQIESIITHYGKDTHLDHEFLSKACDIAGRKISVINFESPNVYDFIPTFFVPLTNEELSTKIDLMKFHSSQNKRNNNFYLDKIQATAIFRGQAVYETFAEAFYIKRLKSPIIF